MARRGGFDSMGTGLARFLVRHLIVASQRAPLFAARGPYSGLLKMSEEDRDDPLVKGRIEYEDHARFLANFQRADFEEAIRDRRVLDFGSGYGGRTVWMGETAAEVTGVEVYSSMVRLSEEFARSMGVPNVRFLLSDRGPLPLDDGSVDVVVSNDVLEHVEDPVFVLDELIRVTRPGGLLFLVFTPYFGMFSHHLNPITMLPGLHWFFPPRVLVEVANALLDEHPRFAGLDMAPLPPPAPSYHARRLCLPTLNGLTLREYERLVSDRPLEVLEWTATPILRRWPMLGLAGEWANRALFVLPGGRELFAQNLVSVLRRAA